MSYPQIRVDLLDLELVLRAFDNACKELKALSERYPDAKVENPYPYEVAVAERLSDSVLERW